MMYPLVTELDAGGIPVTVACGALKLARAPYYRWLAHPVTDAELVEAHRANALFDAHRDDPEFGYRFLADEAREAGQPMAERIAWKICADNGWWSAFGKKGGPNRKKPGPPVHDDLCAVTDEKGRTRHEFTAPAPNRVWVTHFVRREGDCRRNGVNGSTALPGRKGRDDRESGGYGAIEG